VFSKAIVPIDLECVKIVPVFQKRDRKSLVIYRTIAVPMAISKLLETAMTDKFAPFLEKASFFPQILIRLPQ